MGASGRWACGPHLLSPQEAGQGHSRRRGGEACEGRGGNKRRVVSKVGVVVGIPSLCFGLCGPLTAIVEVSEGLFRAEHREGPLVTHADSQLAWWRRVGVSQPGHNCFQIRKGPSHPASHCKMKDFPSTPRVSLGDAILVAGGDPHLSLIISISLGILRTGSPCGDHNNSTLTMQNLVEPHQIRIYDIC